MNATENAVEIDRIFFTDRKAVDDTMMGHYEWSGPGQTVSEAKVHHYTGYDNGRSSGARKRRPSATPDFTVEIRPVDEDGADIYYVATIVANNVPDSGNVQDGDPVAIAKVALVEDDYINDTRWFMLISAEGERLAISPKLISYDGNPEELFEKIHLFDEE